MSFFFKRTPKTPGELVKALNEQVLKLDANPDNNRKTNEEISRYLNQVKIILCGGDDESGNETQTPQPDQIAQVSNEIYSSDCLYILIQYMIYMENDMRNIIVELFSTLLLRTPTIDYLLKKPKILITLMKGPEKSEICLYFGQMIRNAIKNDHIARFLLNSNEFWKYFDYIQHNRFEDSTNAFSTFHDLLTVHKKIAVEFFQDNSEKFTQKINVLISSNSYVAKRQSIKLLSQLILYKSNYPLLTTYVNSPQNLKIIMILLGDKSKNIQIESFHVFKVFIANPKKTKPVTDILIKNREKLLNFLSGFVIDKKDDGVFLTEKAFVIDQIEKLPKIIPNNSSTNLLSQNHSQSQSQGQSALSTVHTENSEQDSGSVQQSYHSSASTNNLKSHN